MCRWRGDSSISAPSWTGLAGGFCPRRLSITMEADFCIEAVEDALARYGKPEIFNTDQGSQFTSIDFTAVLKKKARSPSRWMARARGATTSSSSGSGGRSNTKRSISTPTRPYPRLALASAAISPSTIADVHIHPLTGRRRIRPTSTRWHQ